MLVFTTPYFAMAIKATPDPAFHRRYRGIVGSLGYLAYMTQQRPDTVRTFSEYSILCTWRSAHECCALQALHVLSCYRTCSIMFYAIYAALTTTLSLCCSRDVRDNVDSNLLWGWVVPIEMEIQPLVAFTQVTCRCCMEEQSPGKAAGNIMSLCPLLRPNMSMLANVVMTCCACGKCFLTLKILNQLLTSYCSLSG